MGREERYMIGEDVFIKRYLVGGEVTLYKNQKKLSLADWNRELNLRQPMSNLENHPNPLIRLRETHRRRSFLKMITVSPDDVVADVGCEMGYLSSELIKKCRKIYCVDIDDNMLSKTRQRLNSDKAVFVQSDIRDIKLADDCVDVTIAAQVLEHIPNPIPGIKELVRITRPGGKIYVSVPNERLVLRIKKTLVSLRLNALYSSGLSEQLAIGHLTVFTKRYLREVCEGLVEIERICYNTPFYLNIFARLRPIN